MKINIYMPCYNVDKYIEEAIQSIKSQTIVDWELVILDDASTDNTYEIARTFEIFENNKIRVYRRDLHCGLIGKLKNEAIKLFNSVPTYMAHVGSDDKIPPYCFKTFVDYMDNHLEVGACCGNFMCFDDTGKRWSFPHVANSGEFSRDTLLKYMNLFPMRFYRYEVAKQVGFYSDELSSAVDFDLGLKLDEITKIHRIKEPITYYYRQHANQVSTKARGAQDLNAKTALQNALKRRNIDGEVVNDAPPFIIRQNSNQFIWGKK